jgi:hypothetical protein
MTNLDRQRLALEEYLKSPQVQQVIADSNARIREFILLLQRAETIDPEIVRRKLISSEGEPS